ncbi:hypothetical protein CBER1_04103 [Cercospora berteroae]|uniref:Uncharacterized protein n=1 Tax=Cercospora berteroae TaxID=357750 RepID=A0A2S6CGX4_9PEZI|nr:hypothetical protein CBER1_04103 [Cercospora berteroae]
MSDGGRVTKRPQTPAQKAAKQRTDVERAGKINMYFSRFTGNYYSGYRANLAQIAALLNLADEQESTKLLEHMRDLADASWTGCRRPFSDMAKSERVAAFKTMIQDESHPLDLCVFTKDGPGLDKKRVALRTIFSKGLFSVGDWPEGTDEVDDQTWGTVISVVRSWFHAGISAGTNHWKGQSKAAAEKYKAKQRHPRADESYEQETGDTVHPKRKWTDARWSCSFHNSER